MIQIVPQMRILLAYEPVDFRKGIDTLAALCRQCLDHDPLSGVLFVFRNRAGTSLKLLVYDGTGYWLCQKRFSQGRLRWWPTCDGQALHPLAAQQLAVLLYNGNPLQANFASDWRKLTPLLSQTDQATSLLGSPRG
jgi:transposase